MNILNAFSLNMLVDDNVTISCRVIGEEEVIEELTNPDLGGIESAVGHPDTAAVFSSTLGLDIPYNRKTISLEKGDWVIVGQYKGPRLEEGATKLPDGAEIIWYLISIN